MSGITNINNASTPVSVPPSSQPQVQSQQPTTNPGLSANQVSLATPPASFSQGKRFFIVDNNGSFKLETVSTSNQAQDGGTTQAAFDPTGDALEVNASIAYAITTGQLSASTYMAQQEALQFNLNDVTSKFGASPLETPSLAGEITGEQFNPEAILAFLKHNKSQLDDSNTQADVSSIQSNTVAVAILADLKANISTYESNLATANTEQAYDTQHHSSTYSSDITTRQNNASNALAAAQKDLQKLQIISSKTGITSVSQSLQKLEKEQVAKLVSLIAKSVTGSIQDLIDKNLLAGSPIANPSKGPTENTRDGIVVKTDEQQAQDLQAASSAQSQDIDPQHQAVLAQLESPDFQNQLTQQIESNAQALGLGDLSPSDLQSVAQALAAVVIDDVASNPDIINDAIDNSSTLQSDVTNIVQLELEGQTGRSNTPANV